MKTCVVIPTYNEHENISAMIGAIYGVMHGDVTVCIVDDNSPDGTGRDVEDLKRLFPSLILISRKGKEGLGKAYAHGLTEMASRDFDVVVMMDADFSEHPLYIPELLKRLDKADVVVGSRYAPGAKILGWDLFRRVISMGGNWYVRMVVGLPLYDVSMGFAAIKTEYLKKVDFSTLESKGYAFIMEFKNALFKAGAKFDEIPINFVDRVGGASKMSMNIIIEGFKAPWRVRAKNK
jgi:dolichol-phosphate mannosyltransferase